MLALGPQAVLYAILDEVVDQYEPVVAGLENDIDEIEDELFGADPDVARRIYELFREVIEFQRATHPLRGMLQALLRGSEKYGLDLELQHRLRDVHTMSCVWWREWTVSACCSRTRSRSILRWWGRGRTRRCAPPVRVQPFPGGGDQEDLLLGSHPVRSHARRRLNNELYGEPTTLPWRLQIHAMNQDTGLAVQAPGGAPQVLGYFQPTFLYESLWCLGAAGLLIFLDRRHSLGAGSLFALYTAGRFVFELMRTDYANTILGLRVNTWVAGLLFLGGLALFHALRARPRSGVNGGAPAGQPTPDKPNEPGRIDSVQREEQHRVDP